MKKQRTSFPKTVLLYGLLLGVFLVGFKLFEYSYFSRRITLEIYLGITAVVFLAVGIIVGVKVTQRRICLSILTNCGYSIHIGEKSLRSFSNLYASWNND